MAKGWWPLFDPFFQIPARSSSSKLLSERFLLSASIILIISDSSVAEYFPRTTIRESFLTSHSSKFASISLDLLDLIIKFAHNSTPLINFCKEVEFHQFLLSLNPYSSLLMRRALYRSGYN